MESNPRRRSSGRVASPAAPGLLSFPPPSIRGPENASRAGRRSGSTVVNGRGYGTNKPARLAIRRLGHLAIARPPSRSSGLSAMNVTAPPKFGMGASPRRIEDGSLIRGKGRYTTDVTPPGTLTAYVASLHRWRMRGSRSATFPRRARRRASTSSGRRRTCSDLGFMPSLAHGPSDGCTSRRRHIRCYAPTPSGTSATPSPSSSRTI